MSTPPQPGSPSGRRKQHRRRPVRRDGDGSDEPPGPNVRERDRTRTRTEEDFPSSPRARRPLEKDGAAKTVIMLSRSARDRPTPLEGLGQDQGHERLAHPVIVNRKGSTAKGAPTGVLLRRTAPAVSPATESSGTSSRSPHVFTLIDAHSRLLPSESLFKILTETPPSAIVSLLHRPQTDALPLMGELIGRPMTDASPPLAPSQQPPLELYLSMPQHIYLPLTVPTASNPSIALRQTLLLLSVSPVILLVGQNLDAGLLQYVRHAEQLRERLCRHDPVLSSLPVVSDVSVIYALVDSTDDAFDPDNYHVLCKTFVSHQLFTIARMNPVGSSVGLANKYGHYKVDRQAPQPNVFLLPPKGDLKLGKPDVDILKKRCGIFLPDSPDGLFRTFARQLLSVPHMPIVEQRDFLKRVNRVWDCLRRVDLPNEWSRIQ
ncbi:hypothetical protein HDU85_004469 [Gaertneriomyces sp. JEL0708]|nr:hypothetical protein HDU85_004469 [Gaertneriomyces sp. JEL0708]